MAIFLFDLAAQSLLMLTAALLLIVAYRNGQISGSYDLQHSVIASNSKQWWLEERGIALAFTAAIGLLFYLSNLSLIIALPTLAAVFVLSKLGLLAEGLPTFNDHLIRVSRS